MKIPVFKPHFQVHTIPGDGVYLISEHENRVLNGRLHTLCAPLVNGQNTLDDIVDLLGNQASPAEVFYTLSLMEKKGFISDVKDLPDHRLTPFWTAVRTDPVDAAKHLEDAAVALTVFGDVETDGLVRLLEKNHIGLSDPAPFGVAVTDDFLNPGLAQYSRDALATGMPWLLIKPNGLVPAVGPVFIPDKTACWHCFAERNRKNRLVATYAAEKTEQDLFASLPPTITPGGGEAAFAMAVQEILLHLAGQPDAGLVNTVRTLDLRDWHLKSHAVDRLMHCPACGSPARPDTFSALPPELKPRRINTKNDGGFRTCTPEETLDRLQDRVSPVTGLIADISRNTTLAGNLYVYHARSIYGLPPKNGEQLKQALMTGGSGKGMTWAQAKVSCLCETLECATVVFHGDEKRRTASLSELGDTAVHPNSTMLLSDRQFQNTLTETNLEAFSFRVPNPLADNTLALEWSPVWSLTRNCQRFVLTESLYFHYFHPDGSTETRYAVPTFNGTASGNCLEEAVLHGLLELTERDCIAMWWYNRLPMPGVDPDSFHSPYYEQLKEFYRTLDRSIWVLDLTNDLEIPVFVALSKQAGQDTEQIIFGFGCHLDPGIALHRALTEMNQLLAQMVLSKPVSDTKGRSFNCHAEEWMRSATCMKHPWVASDPRKPLRQSPDFSRVVVTDLLDCIRICRERMEAQGLEVLVKDQTRPEMKLNVATVMVPGLRHFWQRFAPGRLYDVPVKLGWIDQPLSEADLNPIPFFL